MKLRTHFRNTVLIAALSIAANAQKPPEAQVGDDRRNLNVLPKVLDRVGIDQKLGQMLPLDAKFKDESGAEVALGKYFRQKRPVLLALVYYDCTMLCNQVLNGASSALGVLKFDAGKEFDFVAVSFDPRETPEQAAADKKQFFSRYRRAGAEEGLHFLTGDDAAIKAVADTVGFRYTWDEQAKQYAHASALILLTPEGKVAQYYYGIEYSPRDMRLGIIEASQERIGNVVDQMLLYCFHYDPMTGRYGPVIMRILRLTSIALVVALASFMFFNFRRDAQMKKAA